MEDKKDFKKTTYTTEETDLKYNKDKAKDEDTFTGKDEDTFTGKGKGKDEIPNNTNLGLQMTGLQTETGKTANTPDEVSRAREDIRNKELAIQKKEADEAAEKKKKVEEKQKRNE